MTHSVQLSNRAIYLSPDLLASTLLMAKSKIPWQLIKKSIIIYFSTDIQLAVLQVVYRWTVIHYSSHPRDQEERSDKLTSSDRNDFTII